MRRNQKKKLKDLGRIQRYITNVYFSSVQPHITVSLGKLFFFDDLPDLLNVGILIEDPFVGHKPLGY